MYDWSIFAHSNKLYHSGKETLQVLRCLWEKKTQKKKRNGRESSQDRDSIKNHSKKKKKKKALGLSESGHHQDVRGMACDKQDRRKEKVEWEIFEDSREKKPGHRYYSCREAAQKAIGGLPASCWRSEHLGFHT